MMLLTIAIVGCQKDSVEFVPDNNQSELIKANIFGVVESEDNQPIEGAVVTYRGEQTFTDSYGIYTFDNIDIDTKHNVLNISKDGYHLHSRTFRTKQTTTVQLRSKILPLQFDKSFISSQGATITSEGVVLEFPANAIVLEDSETDYQGEVMVAIEYIDNDNQDLQQILPGDLSTLNKNDEIESQEFFGATSVVLQTPSGDKLQIKNGNTVTLKLALPANSTPSDLNAGSFDHNLGLVKEETEASANSEYLVAEVTHFTWWYIYQSIPHVQIDGVVTDQDGNPFASRYIKVFRDNGFICCYGSIASDGSFSGRVPQGESLVFQIFDYGGDCDWSQEIYSMNIGPLLQDASLGTIVIQLDNTTQCSVNGTVVDCDDNPVTDGFIKIGNTIVQVTNGTFDASVIVCDNNPIRFTATNRATQESSNLVMLNAPGENNLGTISACGVLSDFLSLNCDALNISISMYEDINLHNQEFAGQSIQGFEGFETINETNYFFLFTHLLATTSTFNEGSTTIDMSNAGELALGYRPDGSTDWERQFSFESATIEITSGGGEGDVIKGNYTYRGKDILQTNDSYDFYGSFQILY